MYIYPAAHLLGLRVRFPRGHGCLSLVNVCCQVEVSATGRSRVQKRPTLCVCVLLSVIRCNSNPVHLH